jgi:cation diffusion facilitator CzcD-associated flavoprotein CzcO
VLRLSLDWLIIGGGIHGVHIASSLLGELGIDRDKLRIVDPGPRLLDRWRTCTATTGMSHLRSPSVHHLDLDPWSLQHFAGKGKRRKLGVLLGKYGRPSLSLFNSHCDKVIETYGLDELHIKDRATSCSVDCDSVDVRLAGGQEIKTRNLVLAIGAGEKPHWPDWAPREHDCVHHIFEPGFDGLPNKTETVAVVGGGISAAQVGLRLVKAGHQVHMVSRHAIREHLFDSDPGWLGPRRMQGFRRELDFDQRRELISDARHRGSVTPNVRNSLRRAISKEQLRWHEDAVETVSDEGAHLDLQLKDHGTLKVNRILLATGFCSKRPGGSMIDGLIQSASLPCAGCGFPVVDTALRWHSNVYVSGPLAELELGPVSRNIAGARRAAARMIEAVRAEQGMPSTNRAS